MVSKPLSVLIVAAMSYGAAAGYAVDETWVRRSQKDMDSGMSPDLVRRSRKRQSPDVEMEAMANGLLQGPAAGLLKEQIEAEIAQQDDDNSVTPHCQIGADKAPDLRKMDKFEVDSFENVPAAQDCALLCHTHAKCSIFYYMKNAANPLHKTCFLTNWTGQVAQLPSNDCCDTGSPCSADELAAPLKVANQVFKQRERELAERESKITEQRHEIERLQGALVNRQKIIVSKDVLNAGEINKLRADEKELNALKAQNHEYQDHAAKEGAEVARLEKANQIVKKRAGDSSKRTAASANRYEAEISAQQKDAQRLNKALGIRQTIMVGKDVEIVHEKQNTARLSAKANHLAAEVETLTAQVHRQSFYVRGLAAALALSSSILVTIAALVAYERWENQQKTKQPRTMTYCSNSQLTTQ